MLSLMICGLSAAPLCAAVPDWVRLDDLAAHYKLAAPAVEQDGRVVLRNTYQTMAFEPGARRVFSDGWALYLNSELVRRNSNWWMDRHDMTTIVAPLLDSNAALNGLGAGLVVLDPGHGGADPGARGSSGLEEKALTLDVARRTGLRLQACGVKVRLTRDRDRDVGLDTRCEMALRASADLFVSIHFNAATDRHTQGIETFIVPAAGALSTCEKRQLTRQRERAAALGNQNDAANTVLGYWVHRGLLSYVHSEDRGVRRARYLVLRNTGCPATLVEAGFISNPEESRRLQNEDYRQSLANGVASGIMTYLSRVREANHGGV
ncbi:MAG: N-acetylmuramoyl-L-alanine amidase [bacterium]